MDLQTMRTRLRRRIGNPATSDVADAVLNDHLNEAYNEMVDRFPHHKTRSKSTVNTVAGDSSYDLPAAMEALLFVRDNTNFRRLKKRGLQWLAGIGEQVNGKPEHYIRFQNAVEIVPPPDDVYVLEFTGISRVTPLASGGDTPIVSPSWHMGIVLLARWHFFDEAGDLAKAKYALDSWKVWLSNKPTEAEQETPDAGGVEISTLGSVEERRLDFDHSA
jgi:hypothetical protein